MASAADIAARVSVTVHEGIAHVRLTRPDKRNALDDAMFHAIAQAGERVKHDTSVRAVVLSGDGASFCAGLDFGGFQAMGSGGAGNGSATAAGLMHDDRITHLAQQICWVWQEVPVPVIAACRATRWVVACSWHWVPTCALHTPTPKCRCAKCIGG